MRRSVLFLMAMLPGIAAAQPVPRACRLPPGLWAQRQALQQRFDRAGGQAATTFQAIQAVNARYRDFVSAVAAAHTRGQFATVNSCCDGVKNDAEASIFCALVRYRETERKDAAALLAALPETAAGAAALVDLVSAGDRGADSRSLAAAPAWNVTNDLYRLILAGNAAATGKYFWLFRHSGGAYADDVAEQLEDLLANHPEVVIRDWPRLGEYWNLSEGITWDVDAAWWESVIAGFRRRCQAAGSRCDAILELLGNAARAAGAAATPYR